MPASRLRLTNSRRVALIDRIDVARVAGRRWRLTRDGYVVSGSGRELVWLHRVVARTPVGSFTDHRNHNRLDNRRANLRVCSYRENNCNQRQRRSGSGYRGVYRTPRGRFRAQIRVWGRLMQLGSYGSPEEAACAFDNAARRFHGEFARPNFGRDGRRNRG